MSDPRLALVRCVAFLVAVSALPPGGWRAAGVLGLLLLARACFARVSPAHLVRRSAVAAPFLLMALPLAFTVPGPAAATLPGGLVLTTPGLERAAMLCVRILLGVSAGALLAATVPLPALLAGLERLGVPSPLVSLLRLCHRYLGVLGEETSRMIRARRSRSVRGAAPPPGPLWQAGVVGSMAGNLFVRALDRGDRVYAAMAARGYDGRAREAALPPLPIGPAAAVLLEATLLLLLVWWA